MDTALKETPLYRRHVELGGRMVPFAGYSMPVQYSGLVAEHVAVRTKAGLFDVSHMGEIRVRGPAAQAFLNELITGDLERVVPGQALYTCALNEKATFLDDLIVYKWSETNFIVVCNASNREKIRNHIRSRGEGQADLHLADESDETALIALQGPAALDILAAFDATQKNLKGELQSFRFRESSLGGAPVTLARTGYTGEDGVEIFARNEDAVMIWDGLLRAGKDAGIVPAGLGCRDTLRLEARLSLYGHEIDETTNPLEAGLAWIVKLDKKSFLGRAELLRLKEAGLTRKLVGFEMTGRGAARAEYPLLDGTGKVVGYCTSGGPSPTLGKAIGLGYLPASMAAPGTEFGVDCRGKTVSAKVVPTPFYRRG